MVCDLGLCLDGHNEQACFLDGWGVMGATGMCDLVCDLGLCLDGHTEQACFLDGWGVMGATGRLRRVWPVLKFTWSRACMLAIGCHDQ
jgi:hypothetical protein